MKVLQKAVLSYILKFATVFCLCYFGTMAMIGLSAPGKYYSSFADHYLNYISLLRSSLLNTAKIITGFFGFDTYFVNEYTLRVVNGSGIKMIYSCLGFGVMSFWTAFVIANNEKAGNKIKWLIMGLVMLWTINVLRITFLLIANNKQWPIPFFDHHTWFNLLAYGLIFLLMLLYDKHHKTVTKSFITAGQR